MKTKKLVKLIALTLTAISLAGCSKDTAEKQLSKAMDSGHLNTDNFEITLDSLTGEGTVKVTTDGTLEVEDEAYFANEYIPADGYHTYIVGLGESTWEETVAVYSMGIMDESFVGAEVIAYSYQTIAPPLSNPYKCEVTNDILYQELEGGDVWKYTEAGNVKRFISAPGYKWQPTNDDKTIVTSLEDDFTVETPMGTYYHCYGLLTEKEWSDGVSYTLELYASYDYPESGRVVTLFYSDGELQLEDERTSYTMYQ